MTEKPHHLVCLLPARNCEADLPGYFKSVSPFADAIVALDDGSTDSTAKALKNHPLVKILLSNPRRESYVGWDDSGNRNRLLTAARALRPKWIMSLDADERISPDDATALTEFLRNGAVPGMAYGFLIHRMIGDLKTFDENHLWVYRLFSPRRGQRFPVARLHFVPVPTDIPRGHWVKTTLRIQHLSSLTETRRTARYRKYRETDLNCAFQESYEHLLSPPGKLNTWSVRTPDQEMIVSPKRHDRIARQISGQSLFRDELESNRPTLSVIVISQNDRNRIEEVMNEMVRQKVNQPVEMILVNSGNDGTAEFVRENFPEVRVIHLPEPALPGKARNAGLKIARGDYVTFPGSHIVLPPDSLQNRIDAHEKGYTMVTGTVLNGTHTWAGWASYFLDHWVAFPERPSAMLGSPPSRCSYMRGPLMAIGGFPEDRRVGEDTVVNNKLFGLGHKAYRSSKIEDIHRSPCTNPMILLHHHYERGLGFGKMLWEYPGPVKNLPFRLRRIWWLITRYPAKRMLAITKGSIRWGKPMRHTFFLSFPLILAGTLSAALGAVVYLLRPEGKRTDHYLKEEPMEAERTK